MRKAFLVLLFLATVFSLCISCDNDTGGASFTVSFDLGDASLEKIADESVDYGNTVTEPSSIPNRNGYAFAGWFFNEEKYDFSTPITQNITLKAHWTTNYYTVTFDTDGGAAMSSLKIPYGEKINIAGTPADPTRTGYTFDKWTLEDGTQFTYDMAITRDTTIKANWTICEYQVSFDLGYEGATSIPSQTVQYGDTASTVTNPTRSGFIFDGWKDTAAGMFDFANQITRNTELVAQWTEITTNLTLLFPKNVNLVKTLVVKIGSKEQTFNYADGSADGNYLKFTTKVTGFDYGTYSISVTTKDSNGNEVGGSYSDSLVLEKATSDKEVKVDTSNVVYITPTITATATSVTGTTNNYVITGTASMECVIGTTVKYSTDGSTPSVAYTAGTEIAVTNNTTLSYTVTFDGSGWYSGTTSFSGKIDSDIPINTVGATGPAGGKIFYDEKTVQSYSTYSWRFFEASPAELSKCGVGPLNGSRYGTSEDRGRGKSNTQLLKGLTDYAAAKCLAYSVSKDGVTYDDWFLPSRTELKDMMNALKSAGIISTHQYYATSSVWGTDYAYTVLLESSGNIMDGSLERNNSFNVRPVRSF